MKIHFENLQVKYPHLQPTNQKKKIKLIAQSRYCKEVLKLNNLIKSSQQ